MKSVRPGREEFGLLPDIEQNASRRFSTIGGLDEVAHDAPNTAEFIAAVDRCGAVFVAGRRTQPRRVPDRPISRPDGVCL